MTEKHIEFIKCLGGVSKVANACEITKGAVSQWKQKGIPKAQLNFLRMKFPKEYSSVYQQEAPNQ